MNPNTPQIEIDNSFLTTLQQFRDGESISELSENLQTLVAAVRDTQKKGKLIYTIEITPHGKAVSIVDEIKLNKPVPDREAAIFFATDDNILTRDNPEQRSLEFKEVNRPPNEVRDVTSQHAS